MAARRRVLLSALVPIALATSGCYSPYMIWPNFAHPGTAAQQHALAERFDPFPSPDAGPEIDGARPPGYQRPLTETEWGRRYARPDVPLQPVAVPALPSAPVFTSPYPPASARPPGQFQLQPRSPY